MGRITLGFNRGDGRGVSELASVQLQKQQPRSASSVTGVGRFCNGIADSERITPKLDELDILSFCGMLKVVRPFNMETESNKRAQLVCLNSHIENLCYNKKRH